MDKMKKLEKLVYHVTNYDNFHQQEIMDLVKEIVEDTKVKTRIEVLKTHRLI